jgi:hypothetical protein
MSSPHPVPPLPRVVRFTWSRILPSTMVVTISVNEINECWNFWQFHSVARDSYSVRALSYEIALYWLESASDVKG